MKYIRLLAVLLLVVGTERVVVAQNVTNVEVKVLKSKAYITYTLDEDSDVEIYYAGKKLQNVRGSVGSAVLAGNKIVEWTYPSEVGSLDGNVTVDVRAKLHESDMVLVNGGTFTMGCSMEQTGCNYDEKPTHSVTLSSFYIGKTEVTQKQWKEVMGFVPSRNRGDNLPVENVSWEDVQTFIQKLNAKTGQKYRLPTEAEWEYAARGGNNTQMYIYSGGNDVEQVAWMSANAETTTHEVATKQPNELGLYDMSGNVWEWCSDYYGEYTANAVTNPVGPKKGDARVLRGGCYMSIPGQARVSFRKNMYEGGKDFSIGLRLAMSVDAEKTQLEETLFKNMSNDISAESAEAARQAEAERQAQLKAEQDAAKKAEQERIAAEKQAEAERQAQIKAEQEAAKKAEQERIAAEKQAEAERHAQIKAEQDAAKKAEQERIAAEKQAEAERQAQIKAEQEAAKKAEQERIAAEKKAEAERKAVERAEKKEIRVAEVKKNATFFTLNVAYSVSPQLSYGFKVGQAKRWGWYASAMSNFNFMMKTHLKCDETGWITQNTTMPFYTGRTKTSRLSIIAGGVCKVCPWMMVNLGVGYGHRNLYWETNAGEWVTNKGYSFLGVNMDLGVMFMIKGFTISADAVSINGKYLEVKAGLGWCFVKK